MALTPLRSASVGQATQAPGLDRPAGSTGRIPAVDFARTLALAGMVVFHFTRDLEFFGLMPPGATLTGGWALFARLVAGSFIFLAGVSLVLAHGRGLRPGAFLRRFAVIAAAAATVSAATWVAMPGSFVYFGILHAIAAASLVGLLFLRLPVWVTVLGAVAAAAAPALLRDPAFNAPWLLWLGLATEVPRTLDYIPLLPWLAPFLAGMAAARVLGRMGLWVEIAALGPAGSLGRVLAWPGRHSLPIYLLHQPVLIGCLWLYARLLT